MAPTPASKQVKPLFQNAKHAISFFARSAAKQAVKQQLRDSGRRMTLVPIREINEQAEVYLAQHPELWAAALERAKSLGFVQTMSIMVTPDCSVSQSDHATAGTDKSG